MIADFEFQKNGETVFTTRKDLGMIGGGNPLKGIGFMTAVIDMENRINAGELGSDAAKWDQVIIAGKTYSRPASDTPRPPSAKPFCPR